MALGTIMFGDITIVGLKSSAGALRAYIEWRTGASDFSSYRFPELNPLDFLFDYRLWKNCNLGATYSAKL
ncbi:hypothetical protein ASE71_32830 [Ensifer sp. Root954]|nr:hypothetical protein ASD49_29760 [Ensifer sp. Root1298]KQX85631.1 hypothetical protein ASD41_29625 [Ensifer sp. Root1312]KRC21517.1 hypothetical protein ASE29_30445 [Ensifer sp. Root74]KRD60817.1 hypothetical protein ASE71_32830 [Ensifer sp. Root954]